VPRVYRWPYDTECLYAHLNKLLFGLRSYQLGEKRALGKANISFCEGISMEASHKFRSHTRRKMNVLVCIPTYNAAKTIESCLSSILNQTVKPAEILVVDGYSEDETLKIIEKYPDVRVIGFARGIGKARKILASHATGDIIAWVDADVEIPPNWLELHLKVQERRDIKILSSARRFHPRLPNGSVPEVSCEEKPVHEELGIVQAACTMKREIFSMVDYDERFRRGEDWDFVVSAHRKGIRSHYCDGLFAFHISRSRKRYLKDMIYAGNYVTYLRKYGLWYVKFNPKHFLAFLFRNALIYAIPLSFIFPLALLVYPIAWCAYSLDEKKSVRPIKLLVEIMKGIGEHLYLLKIL